jgi:hypothetical protein
LVTGRVGSGVTRRKKSMRIESLFIDEGFGTLDPETLDIALDALEGLRQGNKSIGVISHVGPPSIPPPSRPPHASGRSPLQTLPA